MGYTNLGRTPLHYNTPCIDIGGPLTGKSDRG
jgi:hypothetical protein